MNLLDRVTACDIAYMKCFCETKEQPDFIKFQDDLIPDMHSHNYIWVKNIENDNAFIQLIESEIVNNKKSGKNFCLIRCHTHINYSVLTQLSHVPEVSVSGYYAVDVSNPSNLSILSDSNKIKDCRVLKVDDAEMVEDILKLDLEHDEKELGREFCTRRVYRRKEVYLSGKGVDSYICYDKNKAVGNCDLFIHNDAAKIEDFAVSPRYQRKGYGTAILKSLIETALEKNVDIVYLEADEDSTAKEMYKKLGFVKVTDFTDLLFSF